MIDFTEKRRVTFIVEKVLKDGRRIPVHTSIEFSWGSEVAKDLERHKIDIMQEFYSRAGREILAGSSLPELLVKMEHKLQEHIGLLKARGQLEPSRGPKERGKIVRNIQEAKEQFGSPPKLLPLLPEPPKPEGDLQGVRDRFNSLSSPLLSRMIF